MHSCLVDDSPSSTLVTNHRKNRLLLARRQSVCICVQESEKKHRKNSGILSYIQVISFAVLHSFHHAATPSKRKENGTREKKHRAIEKDWNSNIITGTYAFIHIQLLNIYLSVVVAFYLQLLLYGLRNARKQEKKTPELLQYTSYSFANRNSTIDTILWPYITALIGNFILFAMAPRLIFLGLA